MNHQEAKDILEKLLPSESLSLIKVEVFRLSWEGKGYNIISEETGYDHDYVRKAGSQLWKELTSLLNTEINKRNFRQLIEQQLTSDDDLEKSKLEYPSGALSFSSPVYIERTVEEAKAYQEIQRAGSVVRIKGPRKMGKTSLMLRVLDQADSVGYRSVVIDLQQADRAILSDLNALLKWICFQISAQLSMEAKLDDYWNDLIGSKLSCSQYLQDYILAESDQPLVLVLNEINLLFDFDEVSRDFLPLLRSWHEESKHSNEMEKLRQVLIYSTEVYVQLDLNLSPFNVGLPISLSPFTGEQLEELAHKYGYKWKFDGTVQSPISLLLSELGGHPYLVQMALYELATQSGFVDSPSAALKMVLQQASEPGGLFSDFFQQTLVAISNNPRAIEAFNKVKAGELAELSRIESYQLEHLGIINLHSGKPKIASRMLVDYLSNNL